MVSTGSGKTSLRSIVFSSYLPQFTKKIQPTGNNIIYIVYNCFILFNR